MCLTLHHRRLSGYHVILRLIGWVLLLRLFHCLFLLGRHIVVTPLLLLLLTLALIWQRRMLRNCGEILRLHGELLLRPLHRWRSLSFHMALLIAEVVLLWLTLASHCGNRLG